jgi:hypothetical protein
MSKAAVAVAVLLLGGCVGPPAWPATTLESAAQNFPPLIIGANTEAVTGPVAGRACPAPGGVVEQKGGPTFEYLGASPGNPDLCLMRVGGEAVEGWYGIWLEEWPGFDRAHAALAKVMQGGTGIVVGFDVRMAPGYDYHDLIRNEGVENIQLLGKTYRAIKLAHYREGFDGNIYRSVSTIWKDLATGLLIYGTYQHISGAPVIDDPLIPTRIHPAP